MITDNKLRFSYEETESENYKYANVYCNNSFIGNVVSDKDCSFYNAEVSKSDKIIQHVKRGESLDDGIDWIIKQYTKVKRSS